MTDTSLSIGSDYNLFSVDPVHAKKLRIQNPIISNEDLDKIKFIKHKDFISASVSVLYEVDKGYNGIEKAIENIVNQVKEKVIQRANIIILSERGIKKDLAPIPMLLACSAVHHGMIKHGLRSKFGIVIESAEPREPHHFATLFGYGASAINPYMSMRLSKPLSAHKIASN